MNWKTKHNITVFLWGLVIACVPSGIIFALTKVWWDIYVTPLFGLTVMQLIELPFLDVVAGLLWFFTAPPLLVFALTCIVGGFRLFMERI